MVVVVVTPCCLSTGEVLGRLVTQVVSACGLRRTANVCGITISF